jgi:MraZ protein
MANAMLPLEMLLFGTDEATIDDKGRLLFSKKKRDRLGENFVMAPGPTGCIVVYPIETWVKEVGEVMEASSTNLGRQQYTRLLSGNAHDDIKFDKQGRIVVPMKLRDMARLVEKVLIVGCIDRLEIWDASAWDQYQKDPDGYNRERLETFSHAKRQMDGKD